MLPGSRAILKLEEALLNRSFLPPALPGLGATVGRPPRGSGKGSLSYTSARHGPFKPHPPHKVQLKIAAFPEVALGRPPKEPELTVTQESYALNALLTEQPL